MNCRVWSIWTQPSIFDNMQEQDASEQCAASDHSFPSDSSGRQSNGESEHNVPKNLRVVDWIPDPAASSDPGQLDVSNSRSSSEVASSQWTFSASGPPGRRPNPKLIKPRPGSQVISASSERFDVPVIDYKYRVHTKQLGHLYGLCDAVPYLLGTRSYLKAIVAFGIRPVPIEAYQDLDGRFAMDPNAISILDKVFLMMLWLLRIPVDRRAANWEEWYAGMTIQDDRLIVYKDIGFGREPKVEAMHFYDFVAKVAAWNQLPNPALVAEDRPDVITPWAVVAQKIREKGIPLGDIDKGLYTELVKMTEPQLDTRLTRFSMTNELEERKREIEDRVRKVNTSNTFTYIMPQETNPNVMYAKRFSHQHPNGYLLDTTTPGHDGHLFSAVKMRQDPEELRNGREIKKKEANRARQRVKHRCKSACQWIVAFSMLLGCAVAVMLLYYFKVGGNKRESPP